LLLEQHTTAAAVIAQPSRLLQGITVGTMKAIGSSLQKLSRGFVPKGPPKVRAFSATNPGGGGEGVTASITPAEDETKLRNADGTTNPLYMVGDTSLNQLLDCELDAQKEAVQNLVKTQNDEYIEQLLKFLGEQGLGTFGDVGKVTDGGVVRSEEKIQTGVITEGTFNRFTVLRDIFRPLVVAQSPQWQAPNSDSVLRVCDEALEGAFKSWDSPVAPKLDKFVPVPNSPLAQYLRADVEIPSIPGAENVAGLLLHDLCNDEHKERDVYKHIAKANRRGPTALYATSGGGKTRSIFEYLSHNVGFYFVANKSRNAGSEDIRRLIRHLHSKLTKIDLKADITEQKDVDSSNRAYVTECVATLLYVRRVVFQHVSEKLERPPTAYEWLLFQLYPEVYFGQDVFDYLLKECLTQANVTTVPNYDIFSTACFLDEAQTLLEELPLRFLSTDGKTRRSAFSAFLKAFDVVKNDAGGYPVFSGTGLSIDALVEESRSLAAKLNPHAYKLVYCDLAPLDAQGVQTYLETVLTFERGSSDKVVVGNDLVEHACKWLRGRPRWTATFIETALMRTNKPGGQVTRGRFGESELPFIQALDWYIQVMTCSYGNMSPRSSWSLARATAFALVRDMETKYAVKQAPKCVKEMQEVLRAFWNGVFDYAIDGSPQQLTGCGTDLIESGVALIAGSDNNDTKTVFTAVIDEPLMVEAAVNHFKLETMVQAKLLERKDSAIGQGDAFELALLPHIKMKFDAILKEQLSSVVPTSEQNRFTLSPRSAYGLLAVNCESMSDTWDWIERSTDTQSLRFENQVPPFCFPDNACGPDLLFLLWNQEFTEYQPVLCQAKFRKKVDQVKAIRTIIPELLYHEKRDTPASTTLCSVLKKNVSLKNRWDAIRNRLLNIEGGTRKRKVVRFMVQYPAKITHAVDPGTVCFGRYNTCPPEDECTHGKDYLVSIGPGNASSLFGDHVEEMLEKAKKKKRS
jgi:hypothetical protein